MAAIEEQTDPIKIEPLMRMRSPRRKAERPAMDDLVWNVLTVLVWLGIACAVMAFASIIANPQSLPAALRPYPPTLVSAIHIPTQTATLVSRKTQAAAILTWTPTLTLAPTATFTPSPTIPETATPGPSLTPTIHSIYPFILRGEIKLLPAATFPDHEPCKLWVAGQAYDLQGAPMQGVTVMLGGRLDNRTLSQLSLTGTALQYGQAGYEFTVADEVANSKQTAWIALFDQAMIPLSGKIYFDTYADCAQNLILINFRQVR